MGWMTSHAWRKTTASVLDGSGIAVRLIADQLGHSRVSMTRMPIWDGGLPTGAWWPLSNSSTRAPPVKEVGKKVDRALRTASRREKSWSESWRGDSNP